MRIRSHTLSALAVKHVQHAPLVLIPLFVGPVAHAQGLVDSLVANDGQALDGFGAALALDQDRLIVGSPGAEPCPGLFDAGAAYVFDKQNGLWGQSFRLKPAAPTSYGGFGSSVGVAGDIVAVGAPRGEVNSVATGTLHIFNPATVGWSERIVLTGSTVAAGDHFGASLALEGQRVVVGAPFNSTSQLRGGLVFVFRETIYGWGETAVLSPPPPATLLPQEFGRAVALEGNLLAVGAPERHFHGVGKGVGIVYVFENVAGLWGLRSTLNAPQLVAGQHFGSALALRNGMLAVGAPDAFVGNQKRGRVTVFDLNSGSNLPCVEFEPEGPTFGSRFGSTLAWQGPMLAVGGALYSEQAFEEGRVWLYGKSGAGWLDLGVLAGHKPELRRHFGTGLASSAEDLLVGAAGSSLMASGQGDVSVLALSTMPEFEAYCLGLACPCGNIDGYGGCSNSTGLGARLSASGSLSTSAADLSLSADRLAPQRFAFFFVGSPINMTIGGDGLQCVGAGQGSLGAFLLPELVPSSGVVSVGPGRIMQLTGAVAGDSIALQVWYRDPSGPCGARFNTSNALTLGFRP